MSAYSDVRSGHCNRCWTQLFSEILDLVLQKLALPDCFKFGQVCTSWRSIFLNRRRLTRPPPCFLLTSDLGSMPSELPLWSLQEGVLLKLRSSRSEFQREELVVGSSLGWLVVATTNEPCLHLMNPISNQRVSLPSKVSDGRPILPRVFNGACFSIGRVVISSPPTSGDCIIVAEGPLRESLAWCRLSGQEWTILMCDMDFPESIIFHSYISLATEETS